MAGHQAPAQFGADIGGSGIVRFGAELAGFMCFIGGISGGNLFRRTRAGD